eukprot:5545271-Pyramimonas_sp.AAC.1
MQAALDEMDWILHIDTDELMYPGGAPNYSVRARDGANNKQIALWGVFREYETKVSAAEEPEKNLSHLLGEYSIFLPIRRGIYVTSWHTNIPRCGRFHI